MVDYADEPGTQFTSANLDDGEKLLLKELELAKAVFNQATKVLMQEKAQNINRPVLPEEFSKPAPTSFKFR